MADSKRKKPYTGLVYAVYVVDTEKDIDNDLKMVGDALQNAMIIEDDKNIRMISKTLESREIPSRGRDNIYIELHTIPKDYKSKTPGGRVICLKP
jgi:Holliday junction resolvase RusA-like endonuclease